MDQVVPRRKSLLVSLLHQPKALPLLTLLSLDRTQPSRLSRSEKRRKSRGRSVGVGPRCARPLRQSRNVRLPDELPRRRRHRSRLREREGSP